MKSLVTRLVVPAVILLAGVGCIPVQKLTYDRYDERSSTYVNDTAGYALRFGRDWQVVVDTTQALRLLSPTEPPDGSEISLRALGGGVRVSVQTRRVSRGLALEQLQPVIFREHEDGFRALRYKQVSLKKKTANGIEYMEWVYQLRNPDLDATVVEALFLRGPYSVRLRTVTDTARFQDVRSRISGLLGSLTSVSSPVWPQ